MRHKLPVQVTRSDMPQWFLRSIIFSKVPLWSLMPPRLMNENALYPGHKETLSQVIFGKIGVPH